VCGLATVLAQLRNGRFGAVGSGVEHPIDDHRQGRCRTVAHGGSQCRVECGVFGRVQWAAEHGLGERAEQLTPALPQQRRPFGVVDARRPGALIEGVEPVRQAVSEGDRLPADGVRDRRPFALRITGHIGTATERDRAGDQALRQAGLPDADDTGEQHVRVGDDALLVEHPRVEAE